MTNKTGEREVVRAGIERQHLPLTSHLISPSYDQLCIVWPFREPPRSRDTYCLTILMNRGIEYTFTFPYNVILINHFGPFTDIQLYDEFSAVDKLTFCCLVHTNSIRIDHSD